MLKPYLYVANTQNMGRGVFTKNAIDANTIIEVSPVVVMSASEQELLDKTELHNYIFAWGAARDHCCMALGWIAVYNHSYQSNCEYVMDYDNAAISIKTVRKVRRGEELTCNYNGTWNDPKKVWFETAEESITP